MTRAVLGFAVDRPAPEGLVMVARALSPYARAVSNPAGEVAGWLATSPDAAAGRAGPVVAWWQSGDAVADQGPGVLLVGDHPCPPEVVAVWDGPDLLRRSALSPFLRSRWRRREALPDFVVVADSAGLRVDGGEVLTERGAPAAWSIAAAAAVSGPVLADALSWAVPCVTDRESADRVGAVDGEHVVVAAGDLVSRARQLAGDWPTAARVGRGARRLAERSDISGWLGMVLSHLGIDRGCGPVATPLASRFAELATPPRSPMCERAAAAVAGWG